MNINHKPGSTFRSVLFIIFFFIVGFAFILNNTESYAENEGDPAKIVQDSPDLYIININNQNYKKDRKGPVKFAHKKHVLENKITCFECHHEYKDEDKDGKMDEDKDVDKGESKGLRNFYNPWKDKKKCSECHDPLVKKENAPKLQAAYHLSCKGCHEKKRIFKDELKDNPLDYRKCTTCHQKIASEEKTQG